MAVQSTYRNACDYVACKALKSNELASGSTPKFDVLCASDALILEANITMVQHNDLSGRSQIRSSKTATQGIGFYQTSTNIKNLRKSGFNSSL